MINKTRFVIIGAGQAGVQAALSLRKAGYDGILQLIGREPHLPYQRPPLSKAYLKGEIEEQRLLLRPETVYAKNNIELLTNVEINQIDRSKKLLVDSNGQSYPYDKLLLATGAPPRQLPFADRQLKGIHYLRTQSDSQRLRSILTTDGAVVVIGAGYLGLEVAAVAAQAQQRVTVLEMADRVLARVASAPISEFYRNLHERYGVKFIFGAGAVEFTHHGRDVTGVRLDSGETIECSEILIGIGAVPETTLAENCNLEVSNGIVVDEFAQTSDPSIWAAGDCANFLSPRYGRRLRLESVPNAIEQAKIAAANMLGENQIYDALPWFWSDQYEIKLQTVGLLEGFDQVMLRGNPQDRSFSAWYFTHQKLLAVDAISDPTSFITAKKIITSGISISPEQAVDTTFDLKSLN